MRLTSLLVCLVVGLAALAGSAAAIDAGNGPVHMQPGDVVLAGGMLYILGDGNSTDGYEVVLSSAYTNGGSSRNDLKLVLEEYPTHWLKTSVNKLTGEINSIDYYHSYDNPFEVPTTYTRVWRLD